MSSNNENNTSVVFSINYVREIAFFINDHLIKEANKEVLVQLVGHTAYNLDVNLLNFTLKAWYHFQGEQEELASIEVQNLFNIDNLRSYINEDNKACLPPQAWSQIVAISISHTRALFTKNLAGSALQKVMIPIMNPTAVAKHFFPESFEMVSEKNESLPVNIKEQKKVGKKKSS